MRLPPFLFDFIDGGSFGEVTLRRNIDTLIGGILCDRYGRKRIYQYDMIFYAFGMAWLVFALAPWMIVAGFVMVGLAVGADIPASWSLIAEMAPDKKRGEHSVAQVLWYLGRPVVVLLGYLVLEPLRSRAPRIVFAHLAVLALAFTFLRSPMRESEKWQAAKDVSDVKLAGPSQADWRVLLQPQHLKSMAFLIGMYGMWNRFLRSS